MKFLVLFFVIVVFVFQWRQGRAAKVQTAARKRTAPAGTVAMVTCAHCGVHLPSTEAIQGRQQVYCSTAHRLAREP